MEEKAEKNAASLSAAAAAAEPAVSQATVKAVAAAAAEAAAEPALAAEVPRDKETATAEDAMRALDPKLGERLRELGLDETQVKGVLALAEEHLLPLAEELAELRACEGERARLVRHFGSEEAWARVGPELLAWGRRSLPREICSSLCASAEGVMVLSQLRRGTEPSLIAPASEGGTAPEGEGELRRLMADPGYWKRRDPAVLARVREGFRRIYPS